MELLYLLGAGGTLLTYPAQPVCLRFYVNDLFVKQLKAI